MAGLRLCIPLQGDRGGVNEQGQVAVRFNINEIQLRLLKSDLVYLRKPHAYPHVVPGNDDNTRNRLGSRLNCFKWVLPTYAVITMKEGRRW